MIKIDTDKIERALVYAAGFVAVIYLMPAVIIGCIVYLKIADTQDILKKIESRKKAEDND